MSEIQKTEREREYLHQDFDPSKLKRYKVENGSPQIPKFNSFSGLNNLASRLEAAGGPSQQSRMVRDKRRSLDRAVLYSYQGAFIKNIKEENQYRALINPDKLKQDYDDKIVSVGFEAGFESGDIFEWVGTNTYWLIYLQDLNEVAYFRGEIRRCSYEISWLDENGDKHSTYAAIRGPVETKINYIQKHQISVDTPNYSLNILMPLTEETKAYFKRYATFYLQGDEVCWRVEAIDWISTPGILNVVGVEFYANEAEDDIANGIAGGLVAKKIDSSTPEDIIQGPGFIKPQKQYTYTLLNTNIAGEWSWDQSLPIQSVVNSTELKIKWMKNYSGQFELKYGEHTKTIVVESLF